MNDQNFEAASRKRKASFSDREKALSLLAEYSEKLRESCEKRIQQRQRYFSSFVMSLATVVVVVLVFVTLKNGGSQRISFDETQYFVVGSAIFVGFSATLLSFILVAPRRSARYNADHLAIILERLISTVSQYNEHSSTSIGDSFEFELRLADADASIMMYKDVFGYRSDSSFEYSSPITKAIQATFFR